MECEELAQVAKVAMVRLRLIAEHTKLLLTELATTALLDSREPRQLSAQTRLRRPANTSLDLLRRTEPQVDTALMAWIKALAARGLTHSRRTRTVTFVLQATRAQQTVRRRPARTGTTFRT